MASSIVAWQGLQKPFSKRHVAQGNLELAFSCDVPCHALLSAVNLGRAPAVASKQ